MTELNIGFIPLVDCAVLVAAHEKGFAKAKGLSLALHKERSWATVRDKLNLGHFDAAHLLAGMPVAASLGIGQPQVPTIAPFMMSLNGNAITLSSALYEQVSAKVEEAGGDIRAPMVAGAALRKVVDEREDLLTFAMVHPFSCHNYELRYWLAAAGIGPDRDVRLVVIPPSLMADSLMAGQVDGFCVGEPWSSLAVDMGIARVLLTKADIWRWGPEKVLGLRAQWATDNETTMIALVQALYEAAAWCDDPQNHPELAVLLSKPEYVDIPVSIILRSLTGQLLLQREAEPVAIENFMVFHKQAANFPWQSQGLWLYSQMVRWGQVEHSIQNETLARACFRSDVYRKAVSSLSPPPILPGASAKVEGALIQPTLAGASGAPFMLGPDNFFDGKPFDPDDVEGYLASFSTV